MSYENNRSLLYELPYYAFWSLFSTESGIANNHKKYITLMYHSMLNNNKQLLMLQEAKSFSTVNFEMDFQPHLLYT